MGGRMTPEENEEFNRIEMESRIKQEYVRSMRKTTREEKISRPAVYEVPTEDVQFMSMPMMDYIDLTQKLALARIQVRELGDRLAKLEKTEQKPVGWIDSKGNMVCTKINESCKPLYTTPQQRTWVGLTDEEILKFQDIVPNTLGYDLIQFAKAIEAKLKEKNT
jgi:hypothetical protein